MKKIFTYLAVAALVAVACDDMYGPVETPVAPDKAGSVEIQIDTLGDDTLAFTLSPVGDAAYYSYFVAAGPAQAVDSAAVYQCKLDGLIKGTFKAAEDSVAHLAVGELAPNTPYTIYAVAGSPMGIAGSIAVKEVVTTDGITVKLVDYDDTVSDSTIVLTFSEKVYLGEGKVTATYYARNLKYKEMGTVEAVADSVLVEGNTVTVQFAGLPHGADWSIAWPEGTFTDSAKNKVKALVAGQWAKDENDKDVQVGVWSRKDTVAFALEDAFPKEQQMFNDWQTAMFSVGTAVDSTFATTGKAKPVVNYVTPGKVLTINLTKDKTYGFGVNSEGKSGVWMVCPEEPAFGTTLVFSYPQDSFQDIWGNPTKAAEYATLYAYDYTIDTVVGYYNVEYYSNFYGEKYGWESTSMKIEALPDSEKGNVKIVEFYGYSCETPIVATFDAASGTLTIPSGQYFADDFDYVYGADGYPVKDENEEYILVPVTLKFETYSGDPLVMNMPEAGILKYQTQTTGGLFGIADYYQDELYNYIDLFVAFSAEKGTEPADEEGGEETTALSVKKIAKKNIL
ncbi:MAG: hypothetical protein IKL91_03720 [Bacteroidales bacterium]|nr:hypothetical protein [Bacteroidales bacterium]